MHGYGFHDPLSGHSATQFSNQNLTIISLKWASQKEASPRCGTNSNIGSAIWISKPHRESIGQCFPTLRGSPFSFRRPCGAFPLQYGRCGGRDCFGDRFAPVIVSSGERKPASACSYVTNLEVGVKPFERSYRIRNALAHTTEPFPE